MSKGLVLAFKQLDGASDKLMVESNDSAEYPNVNTRQLLIEASRLIRQVRNALNGGSAYLTAEFSRSFDEALIENK